MLYPNFGYLIPDTLLVQNDTKTRKYKLTFVEVESKKPGWEEYIENKHENYLKLSKDILVYKKWCDYCEQLELEKPKASDFKFSVLFICNKKLDFGKGFQFEKV